MFDFQDKVVLITGASSGIGEALARAFHSKGAHMVLAARRLDRLERLAAELKHSHQQTLFFPCDVNVDGDIQKVVQQTMQHFGQLDVVIANAGFGIVGDVMDVSVSDYRRQFETNVFGVIRTVQASVEELKKTKGRIAIIGSVNGYLTLPGNSPYAMSKFAVRAFARSLYHELLPEGVSVTHIAPGFVESEIRRVDNEGVFHPEAKDKVPAWLAMKTDTAAQKILRAVYCRRAERIITAHGYWAVWVERHFPWALSLLLRFSGIKARPEPAR